MSEYFGFCTECERVWLPRKSPDEIKQPKCSECDATGRSILYEAEADVADAIQRSAQEPEIVRDAKRERRWEAIRQRLAEFIDRLNRTAPSTADEPVAREVQGPFWEAKKLRQEITDHGPAISLDALNGVSDRLDELEADIEAAAPTLERLDDLETAIEEREQERQRVHQRIEELKEEEYERASRIMAQMQEIEYYRARLADIEDEKAAFEEGRESGMEQGRRAAQERFAIYIPCAQCGNLLLMEPGSRMHEEAIQGLLASGWAHETCPPPGQSAGSSSGG